MNGRAGVIVVPALCAAFAVLAASSEYEVKAAFLYNFAKFVEWPAEEQESGVLDLCVIGEDPFGSTLDALEGKDTGDRKLHIRRLANVADRAGCRIVYISSSELKNLQGLMSALASDRGVLSVSDIEGFAKSGGVIELLVHEGKVQFAVNMAVANRSGLNVSSKLLRLATRVEDQ